MKILLRDFNVKFRRVDIFKPNVRNEILRGISNDNGLKFVKFATSKELIAKGILWRDGKCSCFVEKRFSSV